VGPATDKAKDATGGFFDKVKDILGGKDEN
jgi:hypothetical protein